MKLKGVENIAIELRPEILGAEKIRLIEQAFLDAGFELNDTVKTDQCFFSQKPTYWVSEK